MDKKIKLLELTMDEGWSDSEFVLEIDEKKYHIQDKLIMGYWAPEGNIYYKIDDSNTSSPILVYKNFKKIEGTNTNVLINVVLKIGTIVTIARILQGYEIENTGNYFNTFINDEGIKQAIVYPYIEMNWEKFKEINEAYRENECFYENVEKELKEKGFIQNEQGFWIKL